MSRYSAHGKEWEALRQEVLTRDHHTCTYCGNQATEADHVIPRSDPDSPGDVLSNLVAACKPCNGRKSNKTLERITWINPRWT